MKPISIEAVISRLPKARREKAKQLVSELIIYQELGYGLPRNAKLLPDEFIAPDDKNKKIGRLRSIRDDPLGEMHARGSISDDQFLAGRTWQKYWEAAELSNLRAVDTEKDVVDGGRFPDPLDDDYLIAVEKLKFADRALGMAWSDLIRDVLGRRLTIQEAAIRRQLGYSDGRAFVSRCFKQALTVLAEIWGYRTRKHTTA